MKRLAVWSAITLSAAVCNPAALARKPKTMVQVYGMSFSTPTPGIMSYTALLILPDGSHATASCFTGPGTPPCTIEPFRAEKRVKVPCDLLKSDAKGVVCYQSEWYESERRNNDMTLRTGNGKVTYHIDGSW